MIKGKKVELRGIVKDDLEQLRKWRNDPKLRQYFREYRELTPMMQDSWYEFIQHDKN